MCTTRTVCGSAVYVMNMHGTDTSERGAGGGGGGAGERREVRVMRLYRGGRLSVRERIRDAHRERGGRRARRRRARLSAVNVQAASRQRLYSECTS